MGPNTADAGRLPLNPLVLWGALGIVYVVWGSTYMAIRVVIETMPPLLSGGIRFTLAAAILALILLLMRGRDAFQITRRQLASVAIIGILLLTGGNGMVSVAEQYISSGLAALLVASVPLWLVVFRTAARDHPHILTLGGVLVGFAGVAMLSLSGGGGGESKTVGVIVILAASLSWSIGSFLSARLPMPKDPFATSVYEMLAGGAILLVIGLGGGERLQVSQVSLSSWVALAYLVIFGSLVAFTSYAWLLGNAPISLVSTYAYVNPAVAVLLGVAFLGESVTVPMLIAGTVILLGVALVVSTERTRSARAAAPAAAAVQEQATVGS